MRVHIGILMAGVVALGLSGCASTASKAEDKEGDEITVTIDQVPDPVKATLQREAEGANIANVDKETEDEKNIYEADAMIGGKNYEIKVADDGTLVSKKLDDEQDEKDGDKD
jgi:ABC-type glycerol-3-phosphate transport system substrate-binding protein